MKNKLLLDNAHSFIYENCSKNVKTKIADHSNAYIYPTHYKIFSNISNCRVTSDNPYLMTDGALNAIVEYFDFYDNGKQKCTKQDILFCREENIGSYCLDLFTNLIKDLHLAGNNVVEQALCEYIPFAEYTAYKLLIDKYSISPEDYNKYGILTPLPKEDDLVKKAITYLNSSNKDIFEIFKDFIKETTSFKKLDNKIYGFIENKLIPNLKRYNDTHFDGLITKYIIDLRLGKIISVLTGSSAYNDCEFEKKHYSDLFTKDIDYIYARTKIQEKQLDNKHSVI